MNTSVIDPVIVNAVASALVEVKKPAVLQAKDTENANEFSSVNNTINPTNAIEQNDNNTNQSYKIDFDSISLNKNNSEDIETSSKIPDLQPIKCSNATCRLNCNKNSCPCLLAGITCKSSCHRNARTNCK